MSWEEMSRKDEVCPCGAGTYTIVRESDDWNRYDEHWMMNCPKCKENYTLEVKHVFDRDGLDDEIRTWKLNR
jgi:hypothetical protein